MGCTRRVVSSGLGAESVTACEVLLPAAIALQLRGSASAGEQVGQHRLLRENRRRAVAPRKIERDADREEQNVDGGVAVDMPGRGPGERPSTCSPAQRVPFERNVEAGREVELEGEWRHDDEHVEAEIAVYARSPPAEA